MTSQSARTAEDRPFYALHADAYDLLVTDPVEPWVDAVERQLVAAGLPRTSAQETSLLDAGCGTGRHARALADRGHAVTLLDASAALLRIASRRCSGSRSVHADLCAPGLRERFDAVTCRGVLNDLLGDDERGAALQSLAALTRPGGLLLLDLREAGHSQRRADGRWRAAVAALPGGGQLTFRSRPTWHSGRIVVDERYELVDEPSEPPAVHEYRFQMRPWTRAELSSGLPAAGFVDVEVLPGVGRRTPDRLFVVARRG